MQTSHSITLAVPPCCTPLYPSLMKMPQMVEASWRGLVFGASTESLEQSRFHAGHLLNLRTGLKISGGLGYLLLLRMQEVSHYLLIDRMGTY